jgi:predicted DNA-binding transcriptional regulator AlpA
MSIEPPNSAPSRTKWEEEFPHRPEFKSSAKPASPARNAPSTPLLTAEEAAHFLRVIPKLADPDSCCERPTGTFIAKTYGGPMGYGRDARTRRGTDESMSPQFGISLSWLAKTRMRGDGPAYIKVGRSVRYPQAALLQWMKSRQRLSTSEQ